MAKMELRLCVTDPPDMYLGVLLHCSSDLLRVAGVDEGHLDAKFREDLREEAVGSSVDVIHSDEMVAHLQ